MTGEGKEMGADVCEYDPAEQRKAFTGQGQVKVQPSSSPFVPTINAITSSQELRWMVQPAILASQSSLHLQSRPYDFLGMRSPRPTSQAGPGVIRAVGSAHGQNRRHHPLNHDDEEKRRLRRERNKMAAAKCRKRRRDLTDHLQEETEELEREQTSLQTQVQELWEERRRLEVLLQSHASVCTQSCDADRPQPHTGPPSPHLLPAQHAEAPDPHRKPPTVKQEPPEEAPFPPRPGRSALRRAEELRRGAECFSVSAAGCGPSRVMDQSRPAALQPGPGGKDRGTASGPGSVGGAMNQEEESLPTLLCNTLLTY
ncbi:fos-related antigen 2-like [Polymixia lowei]